MGSDWELRTVPNALEQRWLAAGLWTDETLGEVLDRGLAAAPGQVFAVHSRTRPWSGTYADVHDMARRLAGGLRARGVGPGDAVAFQLPNCVEAAALFYATSLLGAVIVPIVHFYGPKEVGYILRRTGVKAFVTMSSFGRIDFLAALDRIGDDLAAVDTVAVVDLAEPREGCLRYEELLGDPVDGPAAVDPRAPALVAYTSGTTADPKGVIHSHRTIVCEVRQLGATQAEDAPPNLTGSPVGHATGMLAALLMPVDAGRPVHLVDVWDPAHVLELMTIHELGSGTGATFFLISLLDHPDRTDEHLHLMRYVGLGGSAVPAAVAERAASLGISVVRMYGSPEHPSITGARHAAPAAKRHNTDGCPLPGVEIRLVDDDGNEVPPGTPGEILSRGPDLCVGYTDPALTAAAFDADGWFRTEDVGVVDADGYLAITDRKKDIIIRGGENISAAEVEEVVLRVPGVAEVAVVAAPDERLGERVCAVVRLHPDTAEPTVADLRAAAEAAGLTRQKWPEQILVVPDFPRTPSGKIQKAVLRRQLSA